MCTKIYIQVSVFLVKEKKRKESDVQLQRIKLVNFGMSTLVFPYNRIINDRKRLTMYRFSNSNTTTSILLP